MKQKDIALVIIVAAVSVVIAIFASRFLIGAMGGQEQRAEVVDPISSAFVQPDTKYFNQQSINPTQTIRIGDGQNQAPLLVVSNKLEALV